MAGLDLTFDVNPIFQLCPYSSTTLQPPSHIGTETDMDPYAWWETDVSSGDRRWLTLFRDPLRTVTDSRSSSSLAASFRTLFSAMADITQRLPPELLIRILQCQPIGPAHLDVLMAQRVLHFRSLLGYERREGWIHVTRAQAHL